MICYSNLQSENLEREWEERKYGVNSERKQNKKVEREMERDNSEIKYNKKANEGVEGASNQIMQRENIARESDERIMRKI